MMIWVECRNASRVSQAGKAGPVASSADMSSTSLPPALEPPVITGRALSLIQISFHRAQRLPNSLLSRWSLLWKRQTRNRDPTGGVAARRRETRFRITSAGFRKLYCKAANYLRCRQHIAKIGVKAAQRRRVDIVAVRGEGVADHHRLEV
jgi:hypothetical protein